MADRLIRLGHETGERNLGVSAKTVSAWERGENIPRSPYRRLLCDLFGASATGLGLCPPEPHYTGPETREAQGDDDVERRIFLQLITAAGITVTTSVPGSLAPPDRRGRWNDTAPHTLLQPALDDLDRRPSAETYLLVAWLARDLDRRPATTWAYGAAIREAERSQDPILLAYVQSNAAYFLSEIGDHRTALGKLAAAEKLLPRSRDYRALRVMILAREARAWAGLRDRDETVKALRRAESLVEHTDGKPVTHPLLSPVGYRWLASHQGTARLRLGDHGLALEALTAALGGSPTKSRALQLGNLAEAHRQAGDLEEAIRVGIEAVQIGQRLGSRQAINRVRQVRGRFPTGGEPRSVDDLDATLRLV